MCCTFNTTASLIETGKLFVHKLAFESTREIFKYLAKFTRKKKFIQN